MLKRIIIPCALLVCSVLGAVAQSENTIKVDFRCLSLGSPIRENLYTQQQGGEAIRIYSNSRTDWIRYSGPNPVVFYREAKNADGQKIRIPVGQFRFSGRLGAQLLLFSESDGKKGQYHITAIDDGLATAPAGSYRILNFTKKDIAGIIGSQRFRTSPGDDALIRDTEDGAVEVSVRLAENAESGPERLYAATWTYSPAFRYLIFIVPTGDRTRGNIKIRKISDLVAES